MQMSMIRILYLGMMNQFGCGKQAYKDQNGITPDEKMKRYEIQQCYLNLQKQNENQEIRLMLPKEPEDVVQAPSVGPRHREGQRH